MRSPDGRTISTSAFLVASGIVLAAVLVGGGRWLWRSPDVVWLASSDGSEWVRPDRPIDLEARTAATSMVQVETTFTVPPRFAGATLSVAGLRRVNVWVDGRRVFDSGPASAATWREARAVPLPATIPPGRHDLRIAAGNLHGPALVRASCDAVGIHTGHGDWRASADGHAWGRAVAASDPWVPAIRAQLGRSAPALWRGLPWLAVVFGVAFAVTAAAGRPAPSLGHTPIDWGRRVRWMVIGARVVLAGADWFRLPWWFGYDARWHYDYVQFVAEHARLPPPDAGAAFFQAPAYYVASAILWRGLSAAGVAGDTLRCAVRLVPLACGVGLAEACHRTARLVFPRRGDLQAVAVVVGGLVPMGLYMSLSASNEPAAGLVGGLVALVAVRFLTHPAEATNRRRLAGAGALLGLAVLTKVSLAAWAVPLGVAVGVAAVRGAPSSDEGRRRPWWTAAAAVAVVAVGSAVVVGPYLVRTYRVAGTPVLSHTVLRDTAWWQDPGYRTPGQLLGFGPGLTWTAYGGTASVWDSLYSTVWADGYLSGIIAVGRPADALVHLDAMACGQWLALGPMAAIIVGAVAGRRRAGLGLATMAVAVFLLAALYVYVTLPIYTSGKGSYLLSTAPCLGVLAAAGCERVMVGRWSRAAVAGTLACWAAASWAAYVV